jgi:sialic acid synthase
MRKINVIAELCCNHQGDMEIAKELIREAKACGADFVKMQKRSIPSMSAKLRDKPYDSANSFGATYGEHRFMLEFSREQWFELFAFAKRIGIGFFATPFDIPSLRFLTEDLNCEYIKMGSTQIHDPEMIEAFSNVKDHKIIMSSGMMDSARIRNVLLQVSPEVLMHTTSAYPCPEDMVNLLALRSEPFVRFQRGLSGHYVSGNGAIEAAAVALGATWIERHFTLDRTWKGSDHAASLEPEGLKNVVKAIRTVERALGDGVKKFEDCEKLTWEKIQK